MHNLQSQQHNRKHGGESTNSQRQQTAKLLDTNNLRRTTARHQTANNNDKVIQLPQARMATTTVPRKTTQDITNEVDGKTKADGKTEADGMNHPAVVAAQAQDTTIHRDQVHKPDVRGKSGIKMDAKARRQFTSNSADFANEIDTVVTPVRLLKHQQK